MKTNRYIILLMSMCIPVILNSQVYVENSGNVGIGEVPNNDPLTQLHIKSEYNNSESLYGGIRIQAEDNTSAFLYKESGMGSYSNNNLIIRNFGENTVYIDDQSVGINTHPYPNYALHVDGNVRVDGYVTSSSDERLKTNVNSLSEDKINDLFKLDAISFNFDAEKLKIKKYGSELVSDTTVSKSDIKRYEKMSNKKHIGFSAQELQKIYPELVSEDEKGYLSIEYVSLIPILVEVLKQQQAQIEELRLMLDKESKEKEL